MPFHIYLRFFMALKLIPLNVRLFKDAWGLDLTGTYLIFLTEEHKTHFYIKQSYLPSSSPTQIAFPTPVEL